jgi:hypothetical protein
MAKWKTPQAFQVGAAHVFSIALGYSHARKLGRGSVAETAVWSLLVVQPGYKTPIKLAFAKYSTAGIHGLGKVRLFEATRVEVVVGFCAAGRTI